ncbi:acyl-CoA-binding protein-like [Plectropomus leopardus]|uniref:acyl-CoA-binding protein-like n=1 Tax=Plectropomus leopardus TaxID=160734 RepID=UPI001C4C69FE|nr:acyl-CoA-binding protein-like [Plectropomus leopardus]
MEESFQKAADEATKLVNRPSYKHLGDLYGLYKQATCGDCNTERPGILDRAGRGKWDAWAQRKGLSKNEAMAAYIDLVEEMKTIYGTV